MSVIGSNIMAGASGQNGYQISRSVRLRSSASAYFSRTPSVAGNRKTWTWSGWVKRAEFGVNQFLFEATTTLGTRLFILPGNQLQCDIGGSAVFTTNAVLSDPTAWYHIVFVCDTTQSTASDRVKIYVNGVQLTSFSATSYPAQNADTEWNNVSSHYIGRFGNAAMFYWDGYFTEIHSIDGQALTPSSFGEINATTGVWSPKQYTGTYGTNGFKLNFSDNSAATSTAIGKDSSGNNNNWTPNNISVTSGVTYDSMLDVPTRWDDGGNGRGNYATLNPLAPIRPTLLDGNLRTNGGNKYGVSTIGMSSGKWYAEMSVTAVGAESSCGLSNISTGGPLSYVGDSSNSWGYYSNNGNKYTSDSPSAYGATYATGDTIGIAFDADSGTLTFYKNNVSQGIAFTGLSSGPYYFAISGRSSGSANDCSINFGQRPFTYTPPAGFKSLNTQNISNGSVTTSGSFTGNLSADGPVVWLNGVPVAMTVNGNAVTFGTHADRTASGFKVRSGSSSYNNSGTNTYSVTSTGAVFKHANAQVNP